MKMRNNKKGALELSMNAIIIIILAITMLGLGLGFMRTFMGKGTESLTDIFDAAKLDEPATAAKPITVPSQVLLKGSNPDSFDIGFYCDDPGNCNKVSVNLSDCKYVNGSVGGLSDLRFTSLDASGIKHRDSVGFKVSVLSKKGIPNEYLCALQFKWSGGSKSNKTVNMMIKVT